MRAETGEGGAHCSRGGAQAQWLESRTRHHRERRNEQRESPEHGGAIIVHKSDKYLCNFSQLTKTKR